MKKRVADIIFETLNLLGIKDCFTVVGGGAMHLNNALALNHNIVSHFNHHEQACAMAAEAYARFSGAPAAVCVTSGPGATNAITGVMGAWVDSVPMIVISGNVRYETSVPKSGICLRYRGLQEFGIIDSVKNMTKYSCYLTEAKRAKYVIQKAYALAMEGRRGPVWIDVPQDIQNAMVEEEELEEYSEETSYKGCREEDIELVFSKLSMAKRPCILMGSGIQTSHCEELFEEMIKKICVPVVGGAWLGDIFYSEHPLYYGLSGNAGPRTGNFILQNADCILAIGNSLSYKQTGYDMAAFAPQAYKVMVDIDGGEYLKNVKYIDKYICCDIREFMGKIIRECKYKIEAPKEWYSYCNRLKDHFPSWEGKQTMTMNSRVNKYYFWEKFLEIMPKDTLLALGNSSVGMAANQIGRRFKEQRMISNYICGSMGYDLPAAIGVALASSKPVICVTGDGSIMMNLQELQTIKYKKLPVKIVVFENAGYGAIKQTCKNFFEGLEYGCSPESGVSCADFNKIASAFGYSYKCCQTNVDVLECLKWLKETQDQCILEVKQQLDDPVYPKMMSKLDENGNMTSPKLQDMYPFVKKEDMQWIMLEP